MADSGNPIRNLELHIEQWLLAYGSDLAIPAGTATKRPATPNLPAENPSGPANSTTQTAPRKNFVPETQDQEPSPELGPESIQMGAEVTAPRRPDGVQNAPQETTQAQQSKSVTLLRKLRAEVNDCTRCKLHQNRLNTVFGEGSPEADVLFIGEAPGPKEDQSGRPFVGPAGQLLDRILQAAMGLQRNEVYIANTNKCHPPGNRAPDADEVASCLPYLQQQVELIRPKVLVCLGRTAAQHLLSSTESIAQMRRREHEYCGIPVIVTWHPAYLLREPSRKRETWEDIKRINKLLGRPEVPAK